MEPLRQVRFLSFYCCDACLFVSLGLLFAATESRKRFSMPEIVFALWMFSSHLTFVSFVTSTAGGGLATSPQGGEESFAC